MTLAPRTPRSAPARAGRGHRLRSGPAAGRDTKADVFLAAAEAFSARGFDGVTVDHIARVARVNKAMIYYHFTDKLTLYRAVFRDMAREVGRRSAVIADTAGPPDDKVRRFVAAIAELTVERPWFPTLMMREIAEGAPRLDTEMFGLMRTVFLTFGRVLTEGQTAGLFRRVHPVLAYLSLMGPLLFNAARERAARVPGRRRMPMFVKVPYDEVTRHMQEAVIRMLEKER